MAERVLVDDAFSIAGRGVVLAPPLPPERVRGPARVRLRLELPEGGEAEASGRVEREHSRAAAGHSRWAWSLVLDEGTLKPPRGARLHLRACDPPDAVSL